MSLMFLSNVTAADNSHDTPLHPGDTLCAWPMFTDNILTPVYKHVLSFLFNNWFISILQGVTISTMLLFSSLTEKTPLCNILCLKLFCPQAEYGMIQSLISQKNASESINHFYFCFSLFSQYFNSNLNFLCQFKWIFWRCQICRS